MLVALPEVCYEFDGDGADEAALAPTLANGTYATGLIGQALEGNLTASASADPAVDLTGDFTINTWVSAAATGVNLQISKSGSYYAKLFINVSTGTIDDIQWSSDNTQVAVSNVINEWAMITAVRQGVTTEFFINGVSIGTVATGFVEGVVDTINLARSTGGLQDQLSIFERALSTSELRYLYNGGAARSFAGMEIGPQAPILGPPVASLESIAYSITPGSDSPSGYRVWRSDNGGAYYYYDNIDGSATTYRVSTGLRAYSVSLKLKAYSGSDESEFSNSQSVA